MKTQEQPNPYLPPSSNSPLAMEPQAIERQVPWFSWLVITVVSEVLITTTITFGSAQISFPVPEGIIIAILNALALLGCCIFCGLRYSRWQAFALTQMLNTVVWGTMIATVLVAATNLTSRDYSIFAMIWGTAAVIVCLTTLLFSRRQNSARRKVTDSRAIEGTVE